jgi:hypothetical protein
MEKKLLTYTLNGQKHVLSSEELEAAEMSGRSTLEWYRITPTIPHRHSLLSTCEEMRRRPGKTDGRGYRRNWTQREVETLMHMLGINSTYRQMASTIGATRSEVKRAVHYIKNHHPEKLNNDAQGQEVRSTKG